MRAFTRLELGERGEGGAVVGLGIGHLLTRTTIGTEAAQTRGSRFLRRRELIATVLVGAMLFALSIIGIFLNRRNLIVLLMAIELMLLAVNMNFVAFSYYLNDMHGQVFVFFILTVAAAESAIGLAILVLLFRNKSNINVDELNTLKG